MDGLLDLLHETITSPWAYLLIFAVSAIDGFFPVVPGESTVITAGVFASEGDTHIFLIVIAAALGALVGDHVSFFVGRRFGTAATKWMGRSERRQRALKWASKALHQRGGAILVVARYIPGGRTAVTLTMGAVGYPLRSFSLFDSIAALSWALYAATLGYVGGETFENDPLKGLLLGFTLAFGIMGLIELARRLIPTSVPRDDA